jgi:hypothetical protein
MGDETQARHVWDQKIYETVEVPSYGMVSKMWTPQRDGATLQQLWITRGYHGVGKVYASSGKMASESGKKTVIVQSIAGAFEIMESEASKFQFTRYDTTIGGLRDGPR